MPRRKPPAGQSAAAWFYGQRFHLVPLKDDDDLCACCHPRRLHDQCMADERCEMKGCGCEGFTGDAAGGEGDNG